MLAHGDRVAALLLEGHPGRVEAVVGTVSPKTIAKKSYGAPWKNLIPSRSNSSRDRRAVQAVDPVMGLVGDLVVLGIGVRAGRSSRQPELVGVDVQHRRVLADDLELAVGLGLGPGEPVAVHVEAVRGSGGRRPRGRPGSGSAGSRRSRSRGCRRRRSRRGGELVQGVERGVGAALLVAVDVGREPQDRRARVQPSAIASRAGRRVAQRLETGADVAKAGSVTRAGVPTMA